MLFLTPFNLFHRAEKSNKNNRCKSLYTLGSFMKPRAVIFALLLMLAASLVLTNNYGLLYGENEPQYQLLPVEQFELSQTILSSTFLGGDSSESSSLVLLDEDDNIIVVGSTSSEDFPTINALYDSNSGSVDCFITKFSNDASEIIYSTYLGGSNRDIAMDCQLGSDGSLYILGRTESTDFPTVNAYDSSHNGDYDCFIVKLNPAGDTLEYSTYVGGTNNDYPRAIEIDSNGYAYISGNTLSSSFPIVNAYDNTFEGYSDDFLFKLNQVGNDSVFSTFIGGSSGEGSFTAITICENSIYMCGSTASSDFPTTVGCYDSTIGGLSDGFILKMPLNGSTIDYSTFFGGNDDDIVHFISIDNSGYVTVSGTTFSDDFPVETGYDMSYNQYSDVFVAKMNLSSSELAFSTFYGGSSYDYVDDMYLDDIGNVYLCGDTESIDLPLVDEIDSTTVGVEGYITGLTSDGSNLLFSSYVGGDGYDWAGGIRVDTSGIIYIVGHTASTDFYISNAVDDQLSGSGDAFLMRVSVGLITSTTTGTPGDADGDGLSDDDEKYVYGTDWQNPDTDSDGCPDGWEVARGLDPLEWTWDTGEAQEHLMTTAISTVLVYLAALLGLILTAVLRLNNRVMKALRSRILLIPGILFLMVFPLVAPVSVYGSEDPGSNSVAQSGDSGTMSMTYTVLESPWYGNTTTLTAAYVSQYIDVYMTVYVTVRQDSTTIGSYELYLGGGYVGATQSKSITLNLAPGIYEISRTYTYLDIFDQSVGSKSCSVRATQSTADGRNNDQKAWLSIRSQLLLVGFGLVFIGIFAKTTVINRKFPTEEVSTSGEYYDEQ